MNISTYVVKVPEFKVDHSALLKAMNTACALVERDAKQKCPVDTGELRDSITFEIRDEGNAIVGEVGTNKEYAPYVCFGTGLFAANGDGRDTPWSFQTADGKWHTTVGQHPQPFLQPALNDNRADIMELFKAAVDNELGASSSR